MSVSKIFDPIPTTSINTPKTQADILENQSRRTIQAVTESKVERPGLVKARAFAVLTCPGAHPHSPVCRDFGEAVSAPV